MKVVLFCGGLGLRMGEDSQRIPKPMVHIGNRPILLHIMKYYAHFGHKEFILCLGYRGDVIKQYFLGYREEISNDFVLDGGEVTLIGRDMDDWKITFVETGLHAPIGERLLKVREHLEDDEMFFANYGDGLTDFDLPTIVERVRSTDAVGGFLCVRPTFFFHMVDLGEDGLVRGIADHQAMDMWVNGGYFCFRKEIFDHIRPGEELVEGPFERLIERRALAAVRHTGFWQPMDTLKDKQSLDTLVETGPPWALWERR